MTVVYSPAGGCVIDVANNQTNHQFTSIIVVHFERCDEKSRHQRQLFQNLDNFYI